METTLDPNARQLSVTITSLRKSGMYLEGCTALIESLDLKKKDPLLQQDIPFSPLELIKKGGGFDQAIQSLKAVLQEDIDFLLRLIAIGFAEFAFIKAAGTGDFPGVREAIRIARVYADGEIAQKDLAEFSCKAYSEISSNGNYQIFTAGRAVSALLNDEPDESLKKVIEWTSLSLSGSEALIPILKRYLAPLPSRKS